AGGRAVDLVVDRVEAAAGRAGDVAGAGRDRVGNRVAGAVGGAEVLDLDREGLVGAGGARVGRGRLGHLQVGGAVDGRVAGRAVVAVGRVGGRLGAQGRRVGQGAAVGEARRDVDDDRVGVGGVVGEAGGRAVDLVVDRVEAAAGRAGDVAGAGRDRVGDRVAGGVGGAEVLDLDREGLVGAGGARAGRGGLRHLQVGLGVDRSRGRVRGVVAGGRIGGAVRAD